MGNSAGFVNAAINILKIALSTVGHTGSKAWGDLPSSLVGEILLGDGESMNQESPCMDGRRVSKNKKIPSSPLVVGGGRGVVSEAACTQKQ